MYIGYRAAYRIRQISRYLVAVAIVVEVSVRNFDFVGRNEAVYPFKNVAPQVLDAVALNLSLAVLVAEVQPVLVRVAGGCVTVRFGITFAERGAAVKALVANYIQRL